MSVCISRHGEYGSHTIGTIDDDPYCCNRCFSVDEEAMNAAIDQARRIACSLESELAEQTDRIAEALNWLAVAATFSTSEDCSAAIDDARAALEVKP